jgi:hypothetical protein
VGGPGERESDLHCQVSIESAGPGAVGARLAVPSDGRSRGAVVIGADPATRMEENDIMKRRETAPFSFFSVGANVS